MQILLNRLRKNTTQRPAWIRMRVGPRAASFIYSTVFFAGFLAVFQAGYGVNDDMKIIPLVAGYPTGHPVPFLVSGNVLLGFLLVGLYRLPTQLNWEVLLFVAVQFVAVWLLLSQIVASRLSTLHKVFGALVVLVCEAYFTLNITFTTTAAFAAIAGFCGLLYAARPNVEAPRWQTWIGGALILAAALLRDKMVLLALALVLPCFLLSRNGFHMRRLLISLVATGLLASGCWLLNRIYVRAFPAWNAYYFYNSTRELIHDTHRLENLGRTIRRIGWSPNDQEVFARWYFPDEETYSLDRLRYLVQRVSPWSRSPSVTLLSLPDAPFAAFLLPYVFLIVASLLWMIRGPHPGRALLPVLGVLCVCLAANAYFALAWKIADRIFVPAVSGTALLMFMIPFWMETGGSTAISRNAVPNAKTAWAPFSAMAALASAIAIMLAQCSSTAATNRQKQALYQQIVEDVAGLERNGILAPDPLILSPAHGLPLEWSDPFTLQLPTVDYFDMGWLTFSPAYEDVLSTHGIGNLPEALYQKADVYLMTRSLILPYMARSFEEHQGVRVSFRSLYKMPNPSRYPGYEDVHLYEVVPST